MLMAGVQHCKREREKGGTHFGRQNKSIKGK